MNDDRVYFIYLFTQHILSTMIKRKVKNYMQFKIQHG